MINTFTGELMIHPAPIEISGNTCSYDCAYCFANIRNNKREVKMRSIVSQLLNHKKRNTILSNLITAGFPICLSNNTDPFAQNNISDSKVLIEILSNMDNGLFIQTKTTENKDELIEVLELLKNKKNVVWYVSLTTTNDKLSKKIEKGAPLPSTRIKNIELIRSYGFKVVCAVNPCVESWWDIKSIGEIIIKMQALGVTDWVLQPIHISKREMKIMKDWRLKSLGEKILYEDDKEFPQLFQMILQAKGHNTINMWIDYSNKHSSRVDEALGGSFPTYYLFLERMKDKYGYKNVEITWDEFFNCFEYKDFYDKELRGYQQYIFKLSRKVWLEKREYQKIKTFKEVLRCIWNEKGISLSPQNRDSFEFLRFDDNKNAILKYKGSYQRELDEEIQTIKKR